MLRERFATFAVDTESVGQERVAAANEICDSLIHAGHSDAPTIAEWKDGINEAWTDLLELMETRTQALNASWELFKFFDDCQETLVRIMVYTKYTSEYEYMPSIRVYAKYTGIHQNMDS